MSMRILAGGRVIPEGGGSSQDSDSPCSSWPSVEKNSREQNSFIFWKEKGKKKKKGKRRKKEEEKRGIRCQFNSLWKLLHTEKGNGRVSCFFFESSSVFSFQTLLILLLEEMYIIPYQREKGGRKRNRKRDEEDLFFSLSAAVSCYYYDFIAVCIRLSSWEAGFLLPSPPSHVCQEVPKINFLLFFENYTFFLFCLVSNSRLV